MKIVLIGCGNITSTRHIPSVRALNYSVVGVVGVRRDAVAAAGSAFEGAKTFIGDLANETGPDWLAEADLFIVGTPPRTHVPLVVALDRFQQARTLSEKPFVVSEEDVRCIRLATLDRISVMHNFQFARGFLRVKRLIAEGRIGEVRSVRALQWSTKDRRLPEWYRDLPLGLFWDESAHFVYLVTDLVGELALDRAWASRSSDPEDPTPSVVGAFFESPTGAPVEMSMNFDAAISEWGLVIAGNRGTLIYDLFRDIPVILPHDGLHTAKQILRTSALATAQHWFHTVVNGQRYLRKRHLYGIDEVICRAAEGNDITREPISAGAGLRTADVMRAVVAAVGE